MQAANNLQAKYFRKYPDDKEVMNEPLPQLISKKIAPKEVSQENTNEIRNLKDSFNLPERAYYSIIFREGYVKQAKKYMEDGDSNNL